VSSADQAGVVVLTPEDQGYSKALLTYISFGGDTTKTAAALGLERAEIDALEARHGWEGKLATLEALRKEKGPEAMAKELNRTINFVQAVRVRELLDRIISQMSEGDDKALVGMMMVPNAKGDRFFQTRALTDLTKAVQTCQSMTYLALGDMVSEREAAKEGAAGAGSLAVLKMLAQTGRPGAKTPAESARLLERTLESGEQILSEAQAAAEATKQKLDQEKDKEAKKARKRPQGRPPKPRAAKQISAFMSRPDGELQPGDCINC